MVIDKLDYISNGQRGGSLVALKLGRECLFQCRKGFGTRQAVQTEINLKIHRRMNDRRVLCVLRDRRDDCFGRAGCE